MPFGSFIITAVIAIVTCGLLMMLVFYAINSITKMIDSAEAKDKPPKSGPRASKVPCRL